MENFGGQGFADVAAKFLPTSIFPEEKEAMRAFFATLLEYDVPAHVVPS